MQALLVSAVVIGVMMLVLWVVSLLVRNASIIDLVWGLGFVLVGWTTLYVAEAEARAWLPVCLVTIWGARLSAYLAIRNHGKPEDYRYRAMREKHGRRFALVSLLTVFLLQGVVMWVVSLPLQLAHVDGEAWLWLQVLGVVLFLNGLLFEAVGDWQLARFKADPENQGKVMRTGLWAYTRHPNYFGDFCVWWGLYLVVLGGGAPWWTVVGPVVMSLFLMKISGVTLLEKSLREKKAGYADYVESTNAFFPGRPRAGVKSSEPDRFMHNV